MSGALGRPNTCPQTPPSPSLNDERFEKRRAECWAWVKGWGVRSFTVIRPAIFLTPTTHSCAPPGTSDAAPTPPSAAWNSLARSTIALHCSTSTNASSSARWSNFSCAPPGVPSRAPRTAATIFDRRSASGPPQNWASPARRAESILEKSRSAECVAQGCPTHLGFAVW